MLGQAWAVLIFWVQGCLSVLANEKKLGWFSAERELGFRSVCHGREEGQDPAL